MANLPKNLPEELRELWPGLDEGARWLIMKNLRAERAAVARFVRAVASGDLHALGRALLPLEHCGQWEAALREIARQPPPSVEVREAFLRIWGKVGDELRREVGDDLVLLDGLRALLPPYTGRAAVIYRGESAWAHTHGTYGPAWSLDESVADHHAQKGMCRHHDGGSVVLRTHAPAEAIIAERPGTAEAEVIVDRRKLGRVEEIRRYPHVPHPGQRGLGRT